MLALAAPMRHMRHVSSGDLSRVLQSVQFSGSARGAVKQLRVFKKGHHSIPDAVNGATQAFLAKLASEELAEEGERFFQRARSLLAYKRKDLALDLGPGAAMVAAKDFVLEIHYTLNETDPSEYEVRRTLAQIRRPDFLFLPACDELFGGFLSEVVFGLTKGAPVEKVIDAIEGLDADARLTVDYPSDCAHCAIRVEGVSAHVRFSGAELSIVFPRSGTPRELWESFLAVRDAFALTKVSALRDLLR